MANLLTMLARLPQAGEQVCAHMNAYHKNAKATCVLLGVTLETGGAVKVLNLTHEEFCALCKVKGVLVREKRSRQRKSFEGKCYKSHYRLNPTAIRKALSEICPKVTDLPLWGGLNWRTKRQIETEQKAFCTQFGCRFTLEPETEDDTTKVYTQGDWFEFTCWCDLGEKPDNWRKNCRSYKTGTDCAEYEIKSAVSNWAPSALWIGLNQNI